MPQLVDYYFLIGETPPFSHNFPRIFISSIFTLFPAYLKEIKNAICVRYSEAGWNIFNWKKKIVIFCLLTNMQNTWGSITCSQTAEFFARKFIHSRNHNYHTFIKWGREYAGVNTEKAKVYIFNCYTLGISYNSISLSFSPV